MECVGGSRWVPSSSGTNFSPLISGTSHLYLQVLFALTVKPFFTSSGPTQICLSCTRKRRRQVGRRKTGRTVASSSKSPESSSWRIRVKYAPAPGGKADTLTHMRESNQFGLRGSHRPGTASVRSCASGLLLSIISMQVACQQRQSGNLDVIFEQMFEVTLNSFTAKSLFTRYLQNRLIVAP